MYHFIVNTSSRSGRGSNIWKNVKSELDAGNIEYKSYETSPDYGTSRLVQDICEAETGDIDLVVLGGDGTINEVVNGITDFDRVSMGVIPVGSGNDFARGIGINRKKYKQQLDAILNCTRERYIDIGEVCSEYGRRYFVISSGFGLDAEVCRRVDTTGLKKVLNRLRLGSLTYLITTVISLISLVKVNAEVKLYDRAEVEAVGNLGKDISEKNTDMPDMIFAAFMNTTSEGGGVKMAPHAHVDDGFLTMAAAYRIPKWKTFFYLPLLALGKHERINGFISSDCGRAVIESRDKMVLHCDGEYVGMVNKAQFRCIPGILKIKSKW